jgi:anaerobic C4-dicarboxylate transporter
MATAIILLQFAIVLALIFKGARVGGIGLGIYGMVGVFILVFIFGLKPGNLPIDVMLIIVSVITAAATLQAAGGLDYLVGLAAKFLRKHPTHIIGQKVTDSLFLLNMQSIHCIIPLKHAVYRLHPLLCCLFFQSMLHPKEGWN